MPDLRLPVVAAWRAWYMGSVSAGDAMDRLSAALDDLAGEDLSGRSGPHLLDRLTGLLTAQNRIAAQVARTVRECEPPRPRSTTG